MRLTTIALSVIFSARVIAQTAPAPPAFDVASVRENKGAPPREPPFIRSPLQVSPGSLIGRNVSLKYCIQWAYRMSEYQVQGPDWLNSQRYDIAAKATGAADEEQLRRML